ncbi:5'/3'-nucleotidase SurE [Colletotrichum graminicola]|uniref:5'/3'-nucleotidase SurE n=1 Tax=Colletotrichum graminicola (strain M1.001 / M2 / FGSC 10212) TaxID=645133 RepID=E3QKD4_COLGM|nr:5'/3'-nucleotidase SurE [Colletotrichum graminicola M1.001]EFQ31322.1 5'/3'-nucleotidase SurE [Colletotrichum graminicola M1.001]WDK19342.1 5'/3'-nucleotidase SurE [Colletotrichum graminicola]
MRLLLVNDDGPPSSVSPYFAPWVDALHKAGHTTVVVIPDRPLSWIGKTHAVGKTLTAASRCPASFANETCTVPGCDETEDRTHRWLVVDGLPASCTQIGLFHTGFKPGRAACARAVDLIQDLARDWHPHVEVYSVNLPMVADIADRPQFPWAPQLADIKRQADESPEGEDLWASLNGVISVAPLRASFTAVDVHK